ncbi:MAG: alpha/beta fold hydrolase [Bradyrhizobiaceae bacterium]|nr:alpha/beta fold hydrolase [Bradyrhizobiaceae bacterium]
MPSFRHGDIEIAFLDEGEGEPIVLVHGFASNKEFNWVQPGWVSTLTRAGRRVIALDNRGHGASTKLYDVEAYSVDKMGSDVIALLDHLNIERADVLGYSMGGRITGYVASAHPDRVRSAIIGGIGIRLTISASNGEKIAAALEAPSATDVTDAHALGFRLFAEQTKSDRRALAACMRNPNRTITREAAASIRVPVLVATGTKDDIAGSGQELAALIPGAKLLDIPDRDHMRAVGDPVFKKGVLEFLAQRP